MNRMLSLILSFILLVSLFSACGSAEVPAGSTPPAGTPSTEAPAANSGAVQEPPAGEKPVLTFWHYFTDNGLEALVDQIVDYEEDGIATIVEEYIPRNDLLQKYTLGVVSNELPDLAMVDNPDACTYAAMGMFVDITDRFQAWDDNAYSPGPLASGTYKDRQYSLPIKSNCIALWTNDDMLAEAGVDAPPVTWEDTMEACEKLKAAGVAPFPMAFCALKTEEGTFQLLPFVQSAGATIDTIDSPEGAKALTFLSDIVKNGYASPEVINWTQNDGAKQFTAKNCAMVICTPNQIDNAERDAPDINYTISYLPRDKAHTSSLGGENMGITKVCADVDAAWDFMTYFLGTENSIRYNVKANTISPHSNVTFEMLYPEKPKMQVYVESIAYAQPRGPHPKWSEVSEAIQIAIQASITGAKTPEEAAADAGAKIAEINASIE